MRYRGPSTNRSANYIRNCEKVVIVPLDCPIGMKACFSGEPLCSRFGRMRSSGYEIVCLDSDGGTGPTFDEVFDVLIEADKRATNGETDHEP